MKKKDTLSKKDREDWKNFLEDTSHVPNKDKEYQIKSSTRKYSFDLHGLTLDQANKKVKEVIPLPLTADGSNVTPDPWNL